MSWLSKGAEAERRRMKARWRQGMFYLAVSCAGGILAASKLGVGPALWGGVLLAAVVAGGVGAGLGWGRTGRVAVVISFAALGAYSAALCSHARPEDVGRIVSEEGAFAGGRLMAFRGVVVGGGGGGGRRYEVEVREVKEGGGFRGASGRVHLRTAKEIAWGSRIEGEAWFYAGERAANPGQFDYGEHLRREGMACLALASDESSVEVTGREGGMHVRRAVGAVRRGLAGRLERLGLVDTGVVPAVLSGERGSIARGTWEDFRRSGTMHLLAISGLHLGIVVGFVWWVARIGRFSARWAGIAAVAAAVSYAVLVGGRLPVVRAAIMAVLFCAAMMLYREALVLSVVSAAALVILVARPLELFSPGFQLSFAAVLGLCYLGGPLSAWFAGFVEDDGGFVRRWARGALMGFGYSLGAWVGVAPLVVYHFKSVSFISPFSNLALIPVASVMVVAGFLASGLSLLWWKGGWAFALSARGAEEVLVTAARRLAEVPGGHCYVGGVGAWWVVGVYVFLVACALLAAAGRRVLPVVLGGLVLGNVILWPYVLFAGEGRVEVRSLAAFGKAAVVLHDGRGGTVVFVGREADRYFAERVIVPYLVERGVGKVDLVVETAGADVRIRDVIEGTLELGAVLRQRRFRGTLRREEGGAEYVGAGDVLGGPGDTVIRIHSARAKDFSDPGAPYFEGLVAEASVGGGRVVVALDAEGGCLSAVSGRIEVSPELLCVVSYRGRPGMLVEWEGRLSAREVVRVETGRGARAASRGVFPGAEGVRRRLGAGDSGG